MNEKPHIANTSLISLIIVAIYIPVITITAEFVPALKNWLATTYGHHWVGKGIIMIMIYAVAFAALYLVFRSRRKEVSVAYIGIATGISIVSSLTITLFFVYEYLIH